MTELTARLSSALAGRYRIERRLGEGGMATVYLAEDLKHKRNVALKVLRPELAAVLGAERFVQEITTTASLQHPHILPLFDSGTADGFLFYVMPYIDGETLRDKLNRETQLGVDEAVKITIDVADALDYAHRQGVIHRDIKPENILLHDGRPTVADFGIALAVSAAAGGRMTETGLSLGTPHYMSPEQATADKDLTARSDIYSLGSVLYELLTGNPPHVGASAQQIIMKIVTEEAAPVTSVRKSVPPNVTAAVSKALEKLPADRFDSAKAFAAALRDPGFRDARLASVTSTAIPVTDWRARTAAPLAVVGVMLLVVAMWGWLRPVSQDAPLGRFEISVPTASFFMGGLNVSPDGRYIIYQNESGQLMVRARGDLESRLFPGARNSWAPFFSPDGASIAYVTGFPGSLMTVGIGGGAPRMLVPDSALGYGGAWGEDGNIYYTSSRGDLMRVAAGGGTPHLVARPDSSRGHRQLVDPDLVGDRGAIVTVLGDGSPQVGFVDFATGATRILSAGTTAVFGPPDYVLIGRESGEIAALPFDARRGETTGPEVALGDRMRIASGGYTSALAVSRGGELFYMGGGPGGAATVVRVDRGGGAQPVDPEWTELFSAMALSPDGRRLALSKFVDGREEIWLKTLDRGSLGRLSFGGPLSYRPAWSPDGRDIIFISDRTHPAAVYRISATGGGEAQLFYRTAAPIDEAEFSNDGQWLLYRSGSGGARDIYAVRLGTDEPPIPIAVSEFEERAPTFSPDGRYVAYVSDESGRDEVYVRPFPDANAAKWPVSSRGGREPRWSSSGRELFYRSEAGDLVAVRLAPGPQFAIAEQRALFSTREYLAEVMHHMYLVLPDDQGFLFARGEAGGNRQIVVVQNWRAAVEQQRGRR